MAATRLPASRLPPNGYHLNAPTPKSADAGLGVWLANPESGTGKNILIGARPRVVRPYPAQLKTDRRIAHGRASSRTHARATDGQSRRTMPATQHSVLSLTSFRQDCAGLRAGRRVEKGVDYRQIFTDTAPPVDSSRRFRLPSGKWERVVADERLPRRPGRPQWEPAHGTRRSPNGSGGPTTAA
jgi:hypothetical protein